MPVRSTLGVGCPGRLFGQSNPLDRIRAADARNLSDDRPPRGDEHTLDADGEVVEVEGARQPSEAEVRAARSLDRHRASKPPRSPRREVGEACLRPGPIGSNGDVGASIGPD